MLKSSRWLWKNHARHMLKVWSMPAPEAQKLVWMKRSCRQQEELRINQRISKVKKLNKYSMDQRTSYATGSCNSSAPHWIITIGKKAEPGLNEIFLIQPTFLFPGYVTRISKKKPGKTSVQQPSLLPPFSSLYKLPTTLIFPILPLHFPAPISDFLSCPW